MPPRYAYWTIVAGGLPTAFRTAEREELLPTFKRIQEKHPDAEMKYFARGRLWASEEDARAAAEARRAPDRRPESRGRDWRPGGEHRDPRQKFKDAKKDRNLEWRKQRFERRQPSGTTTRPPTTTPPPTGTRPPPTPRASTTHRPDERGARPDWRDRPPRAGKPPGQWQDRPPRAGKPSGQWKDRPPRADKPPGPSHDRPPHAGKPQGAWQNRPPREKPHGDPLRRQARPFVRNRFERNQGTEEPKAPPQPKGPDREPKPGEVPKPAPPPRPSEPAIRPPGPPERGRRDRGPTKDRRRRP